MEKIFAFIFQLTGWALVVLFVVSWRTWCCAELALFMLTLLNSPLTKLSH